MKKKNGFRKDKRKKIRVEKKQNHHQAMKHFHQQKKEKNDEPLVDKVTESIKYKPDSSIKENHHHLKRVKKHKKYIDEDRDHKPANKFMEMIKSQGIVSTFGNNSHATAVKKEDEEIKILEKKLKLTKEGRNRLNREYEKDGLGKDFGDFLDDLDKLDSDSESNESEVKTDNVLANMMEEMDEETLDEFRLIQEEESAFLKGMDDLPTDDEALSDEEEDMEFTDNDSMDDEVVRNTALNARIGNNVASTSDIDEEEEEKETASEEEEIMEIEIGDNANENDIQSQFRKRKLDETLEDDKNDKELNEDDKEFDQSDDDEDEEADKSETIKPKEDIYGRIVDPAYTPNNIKKYIPPHLRGEKKVSISSNTKNRELIHLVNRQLNRLSDSNMESIVLEFQSLYRTQIRSDLTNVLISRIYEMCCQENQLMSSLILVSASLIAALHHCIGSEISGCIIESYVRQFHERLVKEEKNTMKKTTMNLFLLIGYFYNFNIIHCTLIYDLFRVFLERFNSTDIECILLLLNHCGYQLRSDDVSSLKEMILLVQERSNNLSQKDSLSKDDSYIKTRFLLDLITDLKQNKKRIVQVVEIERTQKLKKWLGHIKSHYQSSNDALHISLKELLEASTCGRWWVIGGNWKGRTEEDREKKQLENKTESDPLTLLANTQRMNTDIRKRIFLTIMNASDFMDAYEKLLSLNLKDKQEQEIIRILLDCCGQEKTFNPFYPYVMIQFCEKQSRFRFTCQLAFWDLIKLLNDFTPRKVYNLASAMYLLISKEMLSLVCLKIFDFTCLQKHEDLFLQVLIQSILSISNSKQLVHLVERIPSFKGFTSVRDGLSIYLYQSSSRFLNSKHKKINLMKKNYQLIQKMLDKMKSLKEKEDKQDEQLDWDDLEME